MKIPHPRAYAVFRKMIAERAARAENQETRRG
jgi:hypothetical protein